MEHSILHKAEARGHANHGWLDSFHTFSFAHYHNPARMRFGALRVLNDDTVAAGMGFGTHPHDNMEIISIPLEGDLEHRDSMGNVSLIRKGDIQVMSAGTGITHSEYNKNADREVKFLQIWVFPDKRNVTPRYGQLTLPAQRSKMHCIISPDGAADSLWIHQQAWFYLGSLQAGETETYNLHQSGNGVYTFVLSGDLEVNGQRLSSRDGFGVWNTDSLAYTAHSETEFLVMEVPMIL